MPTVLCVLNARPVGLGFEHEAIEALGQWRYEAATLNGEPVEVEYGVTVEWEVN